jgi:metal-sulfur cluster biosynthetic enzyme
MTAADLDAIVRIDRGITGRDRRDYIGARLAEAMDDTSVRVSLAARRDGTVVGYLMARADLGDFGRPRPVAVIDTLGVDRDYARQGVGRALLSQLIANLGALRGVLDPEAGMNIVDLGLVYGIEAPDADGGVTVRLTMTSAACPMADMIIDSVHDALAGTFGADTPLTVEMVWDPPWTPERMSGFAREHFGWSM